jgi:DNA polymerase I
MHVMRLSVKEGMAYDEVLLLCKGDQKRGIEPVQEWDYKRTGAKVFSFQRAYGAGVAKIAASTGMTEEEVQALVDAENLRYPEIDAYYVDLTGQIKANRRPTSRFLPHPETKQMVQIGKSYYRAPDGKLYAYYESPSPEYLAKKGILASFSPTEIRNYIVQGEGGEWMKAAMWLAVRAFYARQNFDGMALLVNTVHDAAYLDAHNSVRFEAAALLHAAMEAASDFMEYLFDWTIPVPVPSDTTWGPSMMDEQRIDGLRERASVLRTELRQQYMKGFVPSFAT